MCPSYFVACALGFVLFVFGLVQCYGTGSVTLVSQIDFASSVLAWSYMGSSSITTSYSDHVSITVGETSGYYLGTFSTHVQEGYLELVRKFVVNEGNIV